MSSDQQSAQSPSPPQMKPVQHPETTHKPTIPCLTEDASAYAFRSNVSFVIHESVQGPRTLDTCSIRLFVRLSGLCTIQLISMVARERTSRQLAYVIVAKVVDGAAKAALRQRVPSLFDSVLGDGQLVGQLFLSDGRGDG